MAVRIAGKNYTRIEFLGQGGFGRAWKIQDDEGNILCNKEISRGTERSDLLAEREVEILGKSSHPNIVAYKGHSRYGRFVQVCMEYCEFGDLYNFNMRCRHPENPPVSPQTVAGIFFQLAAALAYCHWGLGVGTVDGCDQFYVEKSWRAILHRDIKPGNVLLGDKDARVVKLCDFGLSRYVKEGIEQSKDCGTVTYQAPEIQQAVPQWSTKVDIFSLGRTIQDLIQPNSAPTPYSEYDFEDESLSSIIAYMPEANELQRKDLARRGFGKIAEIVERCMAYLPSDRPSSLILLQELGTLCNPHIVGWRNCEFDLIMEVASFVPSGQDHQDELVARLTLLLNEGGTGARETETYETLLHEAARRGNALLVNILLQRGVDIEAPNKKYQTALHIAASEGHEEVVEMLITRGANVNAKDTSKWTPLHWATECGVWGVIDKLLLAGADINAKDKSGKTALYWTAVYGHEVVVERLVQGGAIVDGKDYSLKETALFMAASNGHVGVVQALLMARADPNMAGSRNKAGMMPLHVAATKGHESVVLALLGGGAGVNERTTDGRTALYLASLGGHQKLVGILRTLGAT